MRKSMRNKRVAAAEVSQELDKTQLVRKAALDFHAVFFSFWYSGKNGALEN